MLYALLKPLLPNDASLLANFTRLTMTVNPPRFTPADADRAYEEWGMNCGPSALAAVMGMTFDEVRPHMGDFERKHYTNQPDECRAAKHRAPVAQDRSGVAAFRPSPNSMGRPMDEARRADARPLSLHPLGGRL